MLTEFSNLQRFSYDEFRRMYPADAAGFNCKTYVYADDDVTIAADDSGEWSFTLLYPTDAGWMEVRSSGTYDSPISAYEVAREVDRYMHRAVKHDASFAPEIEGLYSVEFV